MLKKTQEGFEIMQERNKRYLESMKEEESSEENEEDREEEPHYDLEKGDLPAIIISALLTFMPIILALGGALALAWVLLH